MICQLNILRAPMYVACAAGIVLGAVFRLPDDVTRYGIQRLPIVMSETDHTHSETRGTAKVDHIRRPPTVATTAMSGMVTYVSSQRTA